MLKFFRTKNKIFQKKRNNQKLNLIIFIKNLINPSVIHYHFN